MRESALGKTGKVDPQARTSKSNRSNGDSESEDPTRINLCVRCGKSFSKSLELTLRSSNAVETYDACPHCFSRISVSSNLRKDLRESIGSIEKTAPARCTHSLGYLKTHPKETPYPDECLTCAAIMECIVGRPHEEPRET